MISLSDVSESYDFFTGVPDSRLKPFIKEIEDSPFKHIPALINSFSVMKDRLLVLQLVQS